MTAAVRCCLALPPARAPSSGWAVVASAWTRLAAADPHQGMAGAIATLILAAAAPVSVPQSSPAPRTVH
jgi:hypothetical protein